MFWLHVSKVRHYINIPDVSVEFCTNWRCTVNPERHPHKFRIGFKFLHHIVKILYLPKNLWITWGMFFYPKAVKMAMKPTPNGNMTGALMAKRKQASKCMFLKWSCRFGWNALLVPSGENFQERSLQPTPSNHGNAPHQHPWR